MPDAIDYIAQAAAYLAEADRLLDESPPLEKHRPPRPELRLMPTGDDASPSSDPLLDRLTAAVDVLQARAGTRPRPMLTVVREGGDDA